MLTIDEFLTFEEPTDVQLTIHDVLEDIKDMIDYAFSVAKRYFAGATLMSLLLISHGDISNNIIVDNDSLCVEVTLAREAVSGSIQIATLCEARERMYQEIERLSKLTDGWDGEMAKRPSKLALKNASLLIGLLDDNVLSSCAIQPSNDAGIYIQSHLRKGRMTVFVNDSQMAYVIKGSSGKLSASVTCEYQNIYYLNEGLTQYV